jgi:long-subunit acyl-CoA synthetase (AMP-forming)
MPWIVLLSCLHHQAMNRMNGVCVPLYDTLGDEAVQYISEHAEIKLVTAQVGKAGQGTHSNETLAAVHC